VWHVPDPQAVIGIDGCPGGWVGARVGADGALAWLVLPLKLDVAQLAEQATAVAIDIPIGLPTSGYRRADDAARKILGARAPGVFSTPVRPVLKADSYPEACVISAQVNGKAVTRQAWAIVPRIRAVDEGMIAGLQDRVIEAHPEVSFLGNASAGDGRQADLAGSAAAHRGLARFC
jgi:predicted RNase H-like nuclease